MLETLELSDTYRLTVAPDYYADLESVVGDLLGIYTLRTALGLKHLEQGEFTEDFTRLSQRLETNQLKRAIGLWLNLKGLSWEFVELDGYSQGSWSQVIVYGDYDLKPSIEALQQWWRGDVFTVTLEEKETYVHETVPNKTITQWEAIDWLSGVTFSENYDLKDHALEYFPHLMTKEERE